MQNRDRYNNFEDFLQNHANHFSQFPNDKVWNNIRTEMHGNKRWRALLIVFMLIVILIRIRKRRKEFDKKIEIIQSKLRHEE